MSSEEYKHIIIQIFTRLEYTIKQPNLDISIRSRYDALVYRLCHHFGDLRRHSNKSSEEYAVPVYVIPILDALSGIENCHDVDSIFELFKITLVFADTISFDSFEAVAVEGVDGMYLPDSPSPLPPSAQAALPVEVLPPAPVSSLDVLAMEREDYAMRYPPPSTPEKRTLSSRSSSPSTANKVLRSPQSRPPLTPVPIPLSSSLASGSNDFVPMDSARSAASTNEADLLNINTIHPMNPTTAPTTSPSLTDLSTIALPTVPPASSSVLSDQPCAPPDVESITWIRTRFGIIYDRVDTERLRLSQTAQSLDLYVTAVDKHWKKIQRKVESESFLLSHPCQWKLGVAHEGAFPGRRRLVLRPRYDFKTNGGMRQVVDGEDGSGVETAVAVVGDGEQLKRALAKACQGYIYDVARYHISHTIYTYQSLFYTHHSYYIFSSLYTGRRMTKSLMSPVNPVLPATTGALSGQMAATRASV